MKYKYSVRDSVFFDANEGADPRHPDVWPASVTSPRFPRTIYIRHWTLFPHIKLQQLGRFDNQEVIVEGTLIARPRRWKNETGYVIVAEHIGYLNQTGNLKWIAVSDL